MFNEFKKIIKESNLRGWSLQKEKNKFYFSKFDNGINDDEYRIYIEKKTDGIFITRAEKFKVNYRTNTYKTVSVDLSHPLVQKAQFILEQHPLNKMQVNKLSCN